MQCSQQIQTICLLCLHSCVLCHIFWTHHFLSRALYLFSSSRGNHAEMYVCNKANCVSLCVPWFARRPCCCCCCCCVFGHVLSLRWAEFVLRCSSLLNYEDTVNFKDSCGRLYAPPIKPFIMVSLEISRHKVRAYHQLGNIQLNVEHQL